jgi:hypothetical protein
MIASAFDVGIYAALARTGLSRSEIAALVRAALDAVARSSAEHPRRSSAADRDSQGPER